MTTFSRPPLLALFCLLAAPALAEGWRVESQQGDLLRIVPQTSADASLRASLYLCLHDLTGTGRKGFSLSEGPAPQFQAEAGASTCTGTAVRPQVVYLWREDRGVMREVLRLRLRTGDLRGSGLRIDWLAD